MTAQWNRRRGTLVTGALITFALGLAHARAADRPNIIYILADDLGYHELGCYGQEKIQTPNLDRLAAEGMRFTRHYSGSPVCAPSRCVLMTGRHTGHSAIRGNREVGGWGPEEPEGQWPLPDEEVTIAELLKDHGYATCVVGKWGLGGPGSEGHPNRQGFDHFYGYLCQRVAHNYYPTHLWRNHDVDVLHGNRHFKAHQRVSRPEVEAGVDYSVYRGEDYAPAEIIAETLQWVRDHAEQPFFLYYASIIPHVALQVPEAELDRYPLEWDPKVYRGNAGYLPHPRPNAAYAAMITHLDTNVGKIMALLDELELADDTIIMFSSDNGTTFAGGCDREFFASLGTLRGHKCTVFEGGLRVPMIARWPGHIAAGGETAHVSGFQDVLPTLMDILDAEPPPGLDGVSFAPTLLGTGEQAEHEYLYWEYPERDRQQAVMIGDWKGVRTELRKNQMTIALYDLGADPDETTDVAESHPEIVERIRVIMHEGRVPAKMFPLPALDRAFLVEPAQGGG